MRLTASVTKARYFTEEIKQIKFQADYLKKNIALYKENFSLNQERFDKKGQINAYDLLTDEINFRTGQVQRKTSRTGL